MNYINNREDNTRENNTRKKNITICKDQTEIENQVRAWAQDRGKEVKKDISYNGNWQDYAGKKLSVRVKGNTDNSVIVKDFDSGESHFFCLENYNFKEKKTYQKPETKSCLAEFNKLKPATQNHPYLLKKNISIENLNIKQKGNNLVIPVFSPEGKMVSWQTIDYQGEKRFKNKHILGTGYHFQIGKTEGDNIYICEGLATGVSIHTITGHQVYCSLSRSNLDNVIDYVLKKYKFKAIVVCLDNDGEKTLMSKHKKNDDIFFLLPEKEGDFNDFAKLESEQIKLKKLNNLETLFEIDNDEKYITELLMSKKAEYFNKNKDTSKLSFFDPDKQIVAENNLLLLSGDTGAGKTAFSLNKMAKALKAGRECVIWEHDETNRKNRLNKWLEDLGYTDGPPNNLYISEFREDIIKKFKPGVFCLIDDTDGFLLIKKTTDRREVAKKIGLLSRLCQLIEFTCIACHYQTKTSKQQKDIRLRSGGDMTWINKTRFACIIEKHYENKEETFVNEINEARKEKTQIEKSFLSIQKSDILKNKKEKTWWLTDDYEIGDPITPDTLETIINNKVDGNNSKETEKKDDKDLLNAVEKIITDYHDKHRTDIIPASDFYQSMGNIFGIQKTQAWKYLNRIHYRVKEIWDKKQKKKISIVIKK